MKRKIKGDDIVSGCVIVGILFMLIGAGILAGFGGVFVAIGFIALMLGFEANLSIRQGDDHE